MLEELKDGMIIGNWDDMTEGWNVGTGTIEEWKKKSKDKNSLFSFHLIN